VRIGHDTGARQGRPTWIAVMVSDADAAERAYASDPSLSTLLAYVDACDAALFDLDVTVDLGIQATVALRTALAHVEAYRRLGDEGQADIAVDLFNRVRRHAPDPATALGAAADLATLRLDRYQTLGRPADLRSALSLYGDAVRADGFALRPIVLGGFGNALTISALRTNAPDVLDRAVAIHAEAIDTAPADARYRPMLEVNLATTLLARFQFGGQVADLEQAESLHQMLEETARTDERVIIARAEVLWERYALSGQPDLLDQVIAELSNLVDDIPVVDPQFATAVGNLANALLARQLGTGIAADVVGMLREALEVVAHDAPERARLQHVLGRAWWEEYQRTGDIARLDLAIGAWEEAMLLLGTRDFMRPGYLNSVAVGHLQRHAHRPSADVLGTAVRFARRAVRAARPHSQIEPVVWNTLAHCLAARHRLRGRIRDLESAIDAWHRCLVACPATRSEHPRYMANLANALRERAAHLRGEAATSDLEAALALYKDAIPRMRGSQDLPGHLVNLGLTLFGLTVRTADVDHYLAASDVFGEAVELGLKVSPGEALRAGLTWQAMALDRVADPTRAAAAGDGALNALWTLLAGQLVRADQRWWLRTCIGVAATTAAAHQAAGARERAVRAMESGRALMLDQTLPRAARLQAERPDLAERYGAAAARVRAMTPESLDRPPLRPDR